MLDRRGLPDIDVPPRDQRREAKRPRLCLERDSCARGPCRQTSVEKQGDQLEWEIEELGDRQPAAKDGGSKLSKEHGGRRSVLRCEATDRRTLSHEEQHPPDPPTCECPRNGQCKRWWHKTAAEVPDGRAESVIVCHWTRRSVELKNGQRPVTTTCAWDIHQHKMIQKLLEDDDTAQVAVRSGMSVRTTRAR